MVIEQAGKRLNSRPFCGGRYRLQNRKTRKNPFSPPNPFPSLSANYNERLQNHLKANPVGMLQCLCFLGKWALPEYEFYGDQTLGSLHTVYCIVGVFKEKGVGLKKRDAKEQAARAVYDRVWSRMDVNTLEPVFYAPAASPNANLGTAPVVTQGAYQGAETQPPTTPYFEPTPKAYIDSNPIGTLQELCMQRRWHLPAYAGTKINGVHTVTCRVRAYEETSIGVIRKLAKKQCARLVYDRVKNLNSYLSESSPGFEKFENPYELLAQRNPNSSVPPEPLSTSNEIAVKNLIDRLRSSENPCVNAIKSSTNVSESFGIPSEVVNQLGNEEDIVVAWDYIPTNEVAGMCVRIIIDPSSANMVFFESGLDALETQEIAALKYLNFLNNVLK